MSDLARPDDKTLGGNFARAENTISFAQCLFYFKTRGSLKGVRMREDRGPVDDGRKEVRPAGRRQTIFTGLVIGGTQIVFCLFVKFRHASEELPEDELSVA